MKLLTLAMSLFFALPAFAQDHDKGNGGDPFIVEAKSFPDQQRLKSALVAVETKLRSAEISETLREATITEMKRLAIEDKYLYLEAIVLLADIPESYKIPIDTRRFVGLGAMTGGSIGDVVYFSARALAHQASEFSELLLHEVLHHTLPGGLSDDEVVVDGVAQFIMGLQAQIPVPKILADGAFFRSNYFSRDQFFEFLKAPIIKYCENFSGKKKAVRAEYCQGSYLSGIRADYRAALPRDLSAVSALRVIRAFKFAVGLASRSELIGEDTRKQVLDSRVDWQVGALFNEVLIAKGYQGLSTFYCKKSYSTTVGSFLQSAFGSGATRCEIDDQVRMRDYVGVAGPRN